MATRNEVERLVVVETELKNISKKLDDFIDSADERYAAKWTEKMTWLVLGGVLASIVSTLMSSL